eukprot:jgi/Ulvmu1/6450/UM003_0080.1
MPLYLGLDVGTQSCKAVVWDSKQRRVVSSGQKAYDVISTRPGQAEQNPQTWIDAVQESTAAALHSVDSTAVAAVGVSGQQHGLVALDSQNRVIRPAKLWCDVEAAPQATRLSAALGHTVVAGFTAPKLLWIEAEEPGNFERIATVLLPHDYVNFWLTGTLTMECGDASGSGLFDVHARTHDNDAISRVLPTLSGAFPDLVGPNESVGAVRAEAAAALGLPAGVAVAPGSGDNMMSALGVGAVAEGDLVVSLGTSGTLFCPADKPVFDKSGQVAPFCDATGKWLPLLCTMNCTQPPEEVRRLFSLPLADITAAAAAAPPGCDGVNFLPYLAGERTPDWPAARGTLLGLTPGALQRPGLLYRAALEGSTFSLASGIALLEGFDISISSVRLVGGGSRNTLWRQIVADVLGKPVKVPSMAESAALGAALQAAAVHQGADVAEFVGENPPEMEGGEIEPDPKNAEAYAEARQRHVAAGSALFASGTAL